MDRRIFLKSVSTLPVAAAILPTVVAAASPAFVSVVPEAIAPVVEKYPWRWYISSDGGETCFEECDSREDALELAKINEATLIIEAKKTDYDMTFRGDDVLETWADHNADLTGDDGEFLPDVTREQEKDLAAMLNATVQQWVQKHGINITAACFGDCRNEESVELPKLS